MLPEALPKAVAKDGRAPGKTSGNGRPARKSENSAESFPFYISAPSLRSSAER
jgi:hypothetical protein